MAIKAKFFSLVKILKRLKGFIIVSRTLHCLVKILPALRTRNVNINWNNVYPLLEVRIRVSVLQIFQSSEVAGASKVLKFVIWTVTKFSSQQPFNYIAWVEYFVFFKNT